MTTRRGLKRLITAARHDENCAVALAVETMVDEPYCDPEKKSTGQVDGYMTAAGQARDRVDTYLDELAERLRLTTS